MLRCVHRAGALDGLICRCLVKVGADPATHRGIWRRCVEASTAAVAISLCSGSRSCCGVTLTTSSPPRTLRCFGIVVMLVRGAVLAALTAVRLRAVPAAAAASRARTSTAATLPSTLASWLAPFLAVAAAVPAAWLLLLLP